tara:strand:+ start:93 stop:770 length:678 start_codon:yes stop_codon:yes gene_type:complete
MKIVSILLSLFLSGCGLMEQKNDSHKPLYNFKADMQIAVDGKDFDGIAVAKLDGDKKIKLISKAKLDVFVVSSCQRYDKLERLDKGWFGGSGKSYIYNYSPTSVEKKNGCPLYFQAFDKSGLTDWGYITFVSTQTLPATSECSGVISETVGVSVCQVKSGFEQSIKFKEPIPYFVADANCHMTRKSDRSFLYRPAMGFCIVEFSDGKRYHSLTALGFDEIFVRGE